MKSEFDEISVFGRAAYLAYAIELYIIRQEGSAGKWSMVIDMLWSFSQEQYVDDYLYRLIEYLPNCIMEDEYNDDWEYLTREQYEELHELYSSCDYIEKIDTVMTMISDMIGTHIYSKVVPPAESSLKIINERAIPYLKNELNIIPDIQPFKIFSIKNDGGWDMSHSRNELNSVCSMIKQFQSVHYPDFSTRISDKK